MAAMMRPELPRGQLIFAVGDIHGRADLLQSLLGRIADDAARAHEPRKTLVFLGDYIDRGPSSRGVVDMLIGELPAGFEAQCLTGNHESFLLDFLQTGEGLHHWLANGGDSTLASYGVDVDGLRASRASPQMWRRAFEAALPDAHREFYERLELTVSFGDYLFVHAGVRPGIALDAQDKGDLMWIREEFLSCAEPFGKVVVHGHTPRPEVQFRHNRIGIDTGAVFTGRLTALRLEGSSQSLIQT